MLSFPRFEQHGTRIAHNALLIQQRPAVFIGVMGKLLPATRHSEHSSGALN